MRSTNLKALACTISRGGFSDERVFTIRFGSFEYEGTASRRYMWDLDGVPVKDGEPPFGQTIKGLVAARVVQVDGDEVTVSVPDGEVIVVSTSQLKDRPAGVTENVPV